MNICINYLNRFYKKILYLDKTDVSEGIDINKQVSPNIVIFVTAGISQKNCVCFNHGVDYPCIIFGIIKREVINVLKNADLTGGWSIVR